MVFFDGFEEEKKKDFIGLVGFFFEEDCVLDVFDGMSGLDMIGILLYCFEDEYELMDGLDDFVL